MRSPAKIPVIFRCPFSATFSRKLGPTRSAMSRISSQIGFPSVTPNVLCRSPMFFAPCLLITVFSAATPGMMPFGPPLNPAK